MMIGLWLMRSVERFHLKDAIDAVTLMRDDSIEKT